ncbi:hypothetical protein [Pseudaminobacter soli (ex Li et al. 2025)]|uniref:Uncharacterized protein n=1 Tax=Pseudaminobacter soli (ex Li et al. 2025) TaxID=1295366 RepID=A0A2P7S9H5_9HYPH|nr:hypothetical protein [Mesorhizobium soli]PSJ58965.1 hypothetical protein C7I85_18625 [Mesorhizobium soli]
MFTRVVIAALLGFTASAAAVELHHVTVRRGTDGLSPLTLTVTNAGSEAIACHADIAHWYSLELAKAAPGAAIGIELWFDPKTGTYAALNDKRENLPVERLWCGIKGREYATRALVSLDRHAEVLPAAKRSLSCVESGNRLVCR